ncbi:MAG: thioesterase family protein [Bacteroidota bacterium]
MTEDFLYLLRVRYSECDSQQIVFNAKYVEYIDVASMEYFRKVFGDYKNLLKKGVDISVVNVNVSWKSPATYDDIIAMTFKLKKIGNTSITYSIGFSNFKTKEEVAIGEITYVMVSIQEFQKTAIPTEIREQLETGATGVVNHAGIKI